jgi:aspartate racemase
MSWESTVFYYRTINAMANRRLGGFHAAPLVLESVDFGCVEPLMRCGEWDGVAAILAQAAQNLEKAGAACVLICSNTTHKVFPLVEQAVSIPLLHIADATAEAVVRAGIGKVGFLGTRYAMEQDYLLGRMRDLFRLDVIPPETEREREEVNRVIFEELCHGRVEDSSRRSFVRIVEMLASRGAEGVILGCTEIAMLLKPGDCRLPLFDSGELHAAKAVLWALNGDAVS